MAMISPLVALYKPKKLKAFTDWLVANGAELLAPTNEYEMLRYRDSNGVQVIYSNSTRTNCKTSNGYGALNAYLAFRDNKPWRAVPRQKSAIEKQPMVVRSLLARDGADCFYCGKPLGDNITVEHLVSRTHRGPNHISNYALAHAECNLAAGHMSVVEKVRFRETLRGGGVAMIVAGALA